MAAANANGAWRTYLRVWWNPYVEDLLRQQLQCAHLRRSVQSPRCSKADIRWTGIDQAPYRVHYHLTFGPKKDGTWFSSNLKAEKVTALAIWMS